MELKEGDVLWAMRTGRDDAWYAACFPVDAADDAGIWIDGHRIRIGHGSIGRAFFRSRKECLEGFEAKGGATGFGEEYRLWFSDGTKPKNAEGNNNEPIGSRAIYRFDGVRAASVLCGIAGFGLEDITDTLIWNEDQMEDKFLTLDEISAQACSGFLMVINNGPLETEIYRLSAEGTWECAGCISGYA